MDVTDIPTILSNSSLYPTLLLTLMMQRYTPDTKSNFSTEYDYIIVGAGTAGSVLANRLSENTSCNILLLEAGPTAPVITEVPAISREIYKSSIDWNIYTTPQTYANNRRLKYPRAKTIGGCSVHNSVTHIRGNFRDYDSWAAGGCSGWSYDDVLPYFKKLEDFTVSKFDNPDYHQKNGPVTIEEPITHSPFLSYIYEAATQNGFEFGDPNGASQYGFSFPMGPLRDGKRCSTSKAYLVPADQRPNLDIVANAHVHRVLIDENKRATGVLVEFIGNLYTITAKKEVIISAGSIHTPQILMLSGIGPKTHLEEHNIPVISDLPVGKNLQDHAQVRQPYSFNRIIPPFVSRAQDYNNIKEYIDYGTGPLTTPGGIMVIAFITKDKPLSSYVRPDKEIIFLEETTTYMSDGSQPRMFCVVATLYNKGVGSVTLNSADPHDLPVVDPNYFSHPDDLSNAVDGLKFCNEFMASEPFHRISVERSTDNDADCELLKENEDEFLTCTARNAVLTIYHPAGTAKMGDPEDPQTVVDPSLRVKGISNLRVVDASIMPTLIAGHINTPVIMIAEKAADIIRGIKSV